MAKYILLPLLLFSIHTFMFSINKASSGRYVCTHILKRLKINEPSDNPSTKGKNKNHTSLSDTSLYCLNVATLRSKIMKYPQLKDIDLSDPDKWISQFAQPHPKSACYRASRLILRKYNIRGGDIGYWIKDTYANGTHHYSNSIQVAVQMANGTIQGTGREQEGIDYLNWQLNKGRPVIVGLDDNHRRSRYNADNTTEHFVVITGRLTDDKGVYYRFFEVGAQTDLEDKQNVGVTKENKFRLNENKLLIRETGENTSHYYTVVQIRKNY